MTDWPMSE